MVPLRYREEMGDQDLVTAFAPAARASRREVEDQVALLAKNPLVLALLDSVEALIMILNRERQILFANLRLAESLCAPPENLRGMRPGEALGCVAAWDGRAGCGTSQRCAACGVARVLTAPLGERESATAECLLSVLNTVAGLRGYLGPLQELGQPLPRAVKLEQERPPALELTTDPSLVQRVLVNMGFHTEEVLGTVFRLHLPA